MLAFGFALVFTLIIIALSFVAIAKFKALFTGSANEIRENDNIHKQDNYIDAEYEIVDKDDEKG